MCYLYDRRPLTWIDAGNMCKHFLGGTLVSILTEKENDFVRQLVGGQTVWIGTWINIFYRINVLFCSIFKYLKLKQTFIIHFFL